MRHATPMIKRIRMGTARCRAGTFGLVLAVLLIWGCGSTPDAPDESDSHPDIRRLLIIPFERVSEVQKGEINVRCPLCGAVFKTGEVMPDAPRIMTRHLFKFLEEKTEYQLISPGQVEGVRSQLLSKDISEEALSILIEIGRTLGADAIVAGHIYRYQERIGTAYSVDTPASVAFDLHLIMVADGRFVWQGRFEETQTSLSEDCLTIFSFIKRRGKWLKAEELAVSGLEEILGTFPGK